MSPLCIDKREKLARARAAYRGTSPKNFAKCFGSGLSRNSISPANKSYLLFYFIKYISHQ